MLQPERMLLNQLKDSKDVVAQAEAVRVSLVFVLLRLRRSASSPTAPSAFLLTHPWPCLQALGELRISPHSQRPLKELDAVLRDTHVFCRVRMEAAMALAALRNVGNEPAGECSTAVSSAAAPCCQLTGEARA
jgi:hypothetical protein